MRKANAIDLTCVGCRNNYFLHWNFEKIVVFFHEWNEWKNPQLNFSNEMEKYLIYNTNFSIELGKITFHTQILTQKVDFRIAFHTPVKITTNRVFSS